MRRTGRIAVGVVIAFMVLACVALYHGPFYDPWGVRPRVAWLSLPDWAMRCAWQGLGWYDVTPFKYPHQRQWLVRPIPPRLVPIHYGILGMLHFVPAFLVGSVAYDYLTTRGLRRRARGYVMRLLPPARPTEKSFRSAGALVVSTFRCLGRQAVNVVRATMDLLGVRRLGFAIIFGALSLLCVYVRFRVTHGGDWVRMGGAPPAVVIVDEPGQEMRLRAPFVTAYNVRATVLHATSAVALWLPPLVLMLLIWDKARFGRFHDGAPRCPRCAYLLYGLTKAICPECGKSL